MNRNTDSRDLTHRSGSHTHVQAPPQPAERGQDKVPAREVWWLTDLLISLPLGWLVVKANMPLQNLVVCLPCILQISVFQGYRILALFHAIFRERQQDNSWEHPTPRPPPPPPTTHSSNNTTMTIGDGNSNVGNVKNSNNKSTTNVHGGIGAYGDRATNFQGSVGAYGDRATNFQGNVGAYGDGATNFQGNVGAYGDRARNRGQ